MLKVLGLFKNKIGGQVVVRMSGKGNEAMQFE
jgi:hypothetical protein